MAEGDFVSSAKMTLEQCGLLEQYELELKGLREDNLRLRYVEEEKRKLELDIEQIQGVHMQMDMIIGDLKNKAELTDELKNECLNLAGENGELKNRVIQLGDELRAANLKIESLLGNHQDFNGTEGPAQTLGDSYQNEPRQRVVAMSGGRDNSNKENGHKDNSQPGARSQSYANINRGSNSQGYKGLNPPPVSISFG